MISCKFRKKNAADLLEAYVHVKGKRLSWVADRRNAEFPIGGGNAGGQLHCVGPRIIPHLEITVIWISFNHFDTTSENFDTNDDLQQSRTQNSTAAWAGCT